MIVAAILAILAVTVATVDAQTFPVAPGEISVAVDGVSVRQPRPAANLPAVTRLGGGYQFQTKGTR